MSAEIRKIEFYLPEKTLSNECLEEMFDDWSAEKVENKLGINKRHIVGRNETALDLAFYASKKVLQDFDKNAIDFILLCTQSPDYHLPTSSCILQDQLALSTNIGALDFNMGCSGFVYGLSLAKGLISSGIASNVLLVTAETYSKYIHPKDKANRSIFGDGAAAAIVSKSDTNKIFNFVLGTDGSGKDNLIVKNGGAKCCFQSNPIENDLSGSISTDNNLYMNGPEIFNFTIESIPCVVNQVLEKNNTSLDKVDFVIFHQANKYMLNYLRKKIRIPKDKFHIDMFNYGNTVSSTIPIALKDCLESGAIKAGDKVLLCGFGVGYSWGAVIIEI